MYTICIENLKVEAVIGILDKERITPQLIVAHCFIEYKKSFDLFINYAEVVAVIKNMLIEHKYDLLEDALVEIVDALCVNFRQIESIKLKLSKPEILINCVVGVEYFRKI